MTSVSPLRLCLFGAAPDTGNLGVSALCYAVVGGLARHEPAPDLTVFDEGTGVRAATATPARGALRVLAHTFVKPGAASAARVVVLNYYVLNGVPTVDENSFWGVTWRDPNLGHDAGRYVAQVQIAARVRADIDSAERVVRAFAADSIDAVRALLPGTGAENDHTEAFRR